MLSLLVHVLDLRLTKMLAWLLHRLTLLEHMSLLLRQSLALMQLGGTWSGPFA
jgi:hypothetical protein